MADTDADLTHVSTLVGRQRDEAYSAVLCMRPSVDCQISKQC